MSTPVAFKKCILLTLSLSSQITQAKRPALMSQFQASKYVSFPRYAKRKKNPQSCFCPPVPFRSGRRFSSFFENGNTHAPRKWRKINTMDVRFTCRGFAKAGCLRYLLCQRLTKEEEEMTQCRYSYVRNDAKIDFE